MQTQDGNGKTGTTLKMDPEIIRKLSFGKRELWSAAHYDGAENRINGDAILEAAGVDTSLGILSAVFQGIRKAFRNRGKTKEELAAEKEAAGINDDCTALEARMLEYIRAAQGNAVSREMLDELAEALETMHGHHLRGKLRISGERELTGIRRSIENYLAEMPGACITPRDLKTGIQEDEFSWIRELILRQKDSAVK